MFSHYRTPSSTVTSSSSSNTSFSSDNAYISAIVPPPPVMLHQLLVSDLDEISSTGFAYQRPKKREPFRIPRPILTIPRPIIRVPTNHTLWPPDIRPTRTRQSSLSASSSSETYHSEQPLYQNVPPQLPPPPILSNPIQYHIEPAPLQQLIPIPIVRPIRQRKSVRENPPGLFTTLSAGGLSTVTALIYISFLLALPTAKLVLGILYVKDCPINKNIPVYVIVSGACGLAIVIFLLLSSACTFCRSRSNATKSTHGLIIFVIAAARGLQGALAVFLFIWFAFGNIWVFGARYRVRTDKPNDINNYCHPTLYWFSYYVLIFTYVYAIFTCCMKFCVNFFCCGACDIWRKAFS